MNQYDRQDIGLVVEDYQHVKIAVEYLFRIGYDNVVAYLEGGLHAWEIEGLKYDRNRVRQESPSQLIDRLRPRPRPYGL